MAALDSTARICVGCGVGFRKKHGENKGLYCSRACAFAHAQQWRHRFAPRAPRTPKPKPAKVVLARACIQCGAPFTTTWPLRLTCSASCRIIRGAEAKGEGNKHRTSFTCRECGQAFVPVYGEKNRTYCALLCGARHRRRVGKAARDARIRATLIIERVDPFKVFERDNWRCQLCGCSTPKQLRGQMVDDAPELDHIVPLAAGGSHTWANVQCACRRCNGNKGAKSLPQLRLAP